MLSEERIQVIQDLVHSPLSVSKCVVCPVQVEISYDLDSPLKDIILSFNRLEEGLRFANDLKTYVYTLTGGKKDIVVKIFDMERFTKALLKISRNTLKP